MWSANHMAVSQCIWTGRSGQDDLLKYKLASKYGRKVIEKTLKVTSVLVPGRLVWIFPKPVMYCNFPTHPSLQFKENGPHLKTSKFHWVAVQRSYERMTRLLEAGTPTITQKLSFYSQGFSEVHLGYRSWRGHQLPLLSTKMETRLQFV